MKSEQTSAVEWLFEKLWEEPKDKLTWHSILKQAKEMETKQIKCYCGHTTYCDCGPLEEPKQETLEETAKQFYKDYCNKRITTGPLNGHERLEVMIEFAKWQQERSYSEEDIKSAFFNGGNMKDIEEFNYWFKQFKKK